MPRALIVSYRPAPGEFHAVVDLIRAQYRRVVTLGVVTTRAPMLLRSAAGELSYVAVFASTSDVDRCWEDPDFQDLDARLAEIAEMVPARALSEASCSYMDLEELVADEPAFALPASPDRARAVA